MNTFLPDWVKNKKALVNPKSDDSESFKWAVIMFYAPEKHTERISREQRKFAEYIFKKQTFLIS